MHAMVNRSKLATRAEKQEATRRNLLTAAARQIGLDGYSGASIHKITTAAEIANGTFYNYFASQQDLFQKLLPEMGEYLINEIREAIQSEQSSIRREELGFRAFFDYLAANPSFYRVLNEGETFVPQAYADHMQNMVDGYLRALQKARAKSEVRDYNDRELEVIVYILLSARNYLAYRYTFQNGKAGRLPDWVVQAYMKFIECGLAPNRPKSGSARSDVAAERPEQRYERRHASPGKAELHMTIEDGSLDDLGQIKRGDIAGLVERVGSDAITGDAGRDFTMTSLAVNFMRLSHARTLVATGERTAVSDHLAHVTVNVYENAAEGDVIASGLAVFTFDVR